MSPTGKSGKAKQPESSASLSEQAHKQVMDYLDFAEKSEHPEIRDKALKLAEDTSKYERQQKARVSPSLILSVNIVLAIAVVLGCWYAFLHYPQRLAWELSGVSILVFLAIVGVSLYLAGRLSEQHLMNILEWLSSHVKEKLRSSKPDSRSPTDTGTN